MEAPLIQGMGSTQDEEAQKTSCETHMCLLCPCDDTPLTCPETAYCHADLANNAPDPRTGYFGCCLNALLPGCGTCTVGCMKGSRRAKCVGFLTIPVAISTALVVLINRDHQIHESGSCTVSNTVVWPSCDYNHRDLHNPYCNTRLCSVDDLYDAKACEAVTYEGERACQYTARSNSHERIAIGCGLIIFAMYMFTCAWSSSIAGFLSRKPDEPREPAWKFMTTVPTVNPCEAVGFGVLNCLIPGAGAVSAGAVGTENRAYGVKAGGYQMLLAAAPFLVMVVVQIALFSSVVSGNVNQMQVFMGLSPIPFTLATACYALNWLWSCLYGYLLIKHNTQLCSHFDALATPILPVATAPTLPNGSYRGAE